MTKSPRKLSDAEKTEFSARFCHEQNNFLNRLLGLAQLAQSTDDLLERQKFLQTIEDQTKLAGGTLHQLHRLLRDQEEWSDIKSGWLQLGQFLKHVVGSQVEIIWADPSEFPNSRFLMSDARNALLQLILEAERGTKITCFMRDEKDRIEIHAEISPPLAEDALSGWEIKAAGHYLLPLSLQDAQRTDPGRINTTTILMVEDEKIAGQLVEMALKKNQISVDLAMNLEQARQFLESGTEYDGIILDLHLPDGSGLELWETIKRMARHPKIVVISGAMPSNLPEGVLFLAKPYRLQELTEHFVHP